MSTGTPNWQSFVHISAMGLEPNNGHAADFCKPTEAQISICQHWIRAHCAPIKTPSLRSRSSYGLKHQVEHCYGGYVTNGSFIEAMRREGYTVVRDHISSPNAVFNASYRTARACREDYTSSAGRRACTRVASTPRSSPFPRKSPRPPRPPPRRRRPTTAPTDS